MENKDISYFKSCKSTTPLTVNIAAALHWIKSGSSKECIEKIRTAKSESEKNSIKGTLPAVTFGGVFQGRSTLLSSSGYACLDFDKVTDLDNLRNNLSGSPHVYSFWLSPSGNGIKALVPIPKVRDKQEYKSYYKAILKHFEELEPDIATKDINRLCYESYDPDLFIKEDAQIFKKRVAPKAPQSKPIPNTDTNLPEGKIVDRIISWWVKKFPFAKGSRNNNLFVLACALCNFGVSKSTTEDLFYSFEDDDFSYNEIQQIINSAYKTADFNSQSFSR